VLLLIIKIVGKYFVAGLLQSNDAWIKEFTQLIPQETDILNRKMSDVIPFLQSSIPILASSISKFIFHIPFQYSLSSTIVAAMFILTDFYQTRPIF